MPELHVNLTDRHVEGEIVLKGGERADSFAADYAMQDVPAAPAEGVAGGPVVTLSNIVVSREWMQRVAEDMVAGKPWPIPADAVRMLKMTGLL